MFIMRSKVTITDMDKDLIHIGFAGEFADLDVQRLLSTKVKTDYQTAKIDLEDVNATLVKVPGPYHRYEIFASEKDMQIIWKKLKSNADTTNSADWRLLDLAYGTPKINAQTQGQFLPQFLNLDKLEAINFKKGCYPGQEIVARIHYRGKVTKRMMRIHLTEIIPLNSGEELRLKDDENKSFKFTVIASNPDILSGTLCLAIGSLKPLESVTGLLKTESGITATLEPLAYDLADE